MILITSPSLNPNENVSGISSVTRFIIDRNKGKQYCHFILGKRDNQNRGIGWLLHLAIAYLKWIKLNSTEKNILIHFNLSLTKPSVMRDCPLIIISRIFHRRIVIHLHGGEYLLHKNPPAIVKFFLRAVFREDIPKIVLSPLEAKNLQKKFNTNNTWVLPNCPDLTDSEGFNRPPCFDTSLTLLFIGRISKDKGLDYILQALLSLKSRGVKFRFVMAGAGQDEKKYVFQFRENLGNMFEFKGVVTGQEKSCLLRKCNVFLLPSLFEGLPMSLIESMSYGLVPVTTDAGSMKYVISDGKTGIIVKMHSSEDIAAAVEKLSTDHAALNAISRNAREYIFRTFDPETYINSLNEIYNYA
ncbi:MAG TPA: glycosyltransferase family 4 protein [Bacteroidales bacterium]|nr:glycosyltransferase family 4 protein [Bacteroidales bacterium]